MRLSHSSLKVTHSIVLVLLPQDQTCAYIRILPMEPPIFLAPISPHTQISKHVITHTSLGGSVVMMIV